MRTWTAHQSSTLGSPGGRDQARPLQSDDGSWFQMMGCGAQMAGPTAHVGGGSVCRFKATDTKKLSAWEFAGYLWQTNTTIFGARLDFCEVPDFFPLSNGGDHHKHVLVVDPWGSNQWNGSAGHDIQPLPTPSASYDPHVHNVQWIVGDWSTDGMDFTPGQAGCLDYGWWYAARSIADGTNTGAVFCRVPGRQ